jgi:hypothetical protein
LWWAFDFNHVTSERRLTGGPEDAPNILMTCLVAGIDCNQENARAAAYVGSQDPRQTKNNDHPNAGSRSGDSVPVTFGVQAVVLMMVPVV